LSPAILISPSPVLLYEYNSVLILCEFVICELVISCGIVLTSKLWALGFGLTLDKDDVVVTRQFDKAGAGERTLNFAKSNGGIVFERFWAHTTQGRHSPI
jgi:hypothetical protein